MNVNWKTMLIAGLTVCLAVSLFFNGYIYYQLTSKHSPAFFSFVFDSTMQKLVNGTLYLNLTFEVVEGNLTVKAEVNAESYNRYAALALQFDSDNNGTIDIRYWEELDSGYFGPGDDLAFFLRPNNETRPTTSIHWYWYPDGRIYACSTFSGGFFERESPYHYCTYENSVYTFHFTHRRTHENPNLAIQGKLVRVLYGIVPFNGEAAKGMSVYIPPFKFME